MARHLPDDDLPRQPEISPLQSAQHRRAWREPVDLEAEVLGL
jgi:hypothetical protein